MMDQHWQTILIDGFAQMSGWEIVAALLGVGYILFAAKTSLWCWLFAFVSTLIYTVLFWEGQLPMQALLNFYYMGVAVYGFLLWRKHGDVEDTLPITSWQWPRHAVFLLAGIAISGLTAYYLSSTGASKQPYLDASVTVFSVMNTWLMTRKVLENWLYWVVIDLAAVQLYLNTGYYATALLFLVYTVLAVSGYMSWLKLYRNKSAVT
jgi:nicotinamide mononucleotide transporter